MKTQLITIALLTISVAGMAAPKTSIVVRKEGSARTIFINDSQFIEITPKGERFYCEEDSKGKSSCVAEEKLPVQPQDEASQAVYDYCVHSQLTFWNKRFKSYADAVLKAQDKCEKLLPPVVECSTDADCCEKNAIRCSAETELLDAREVSLLIQSDDDGTDEDDSESIVV